MTTRAVLGSEPTPEERKIKKQLAAAPRHSLHDEIAEELTTRGFVLKDGVWRYKNVSVSDDAIHGLLTLWDGSPDMKQSILEQLPLGEGDAVSRLGKLTGDA